MTYLPTRDTIDYQPPLGTATVPPTGSIAVPQSPSGSVTGESADFNFVETITSTEQELTSVLEVQSAQQGTPTLDASNQQTIAGCPSVAVNNFYGGNAGSVGNKFS